MSSLPLITLSVIAAGSMSALIITVILSHMQRKKLLQRLDDMLELAINGAFYPQNPIDESLLSALEFKLYRCLSSLEKSAGKLSDEQNKIKELISDISHQCKTPIAALLLYSELLQEQKLSDESADYAKAIRLQVQKLNFLTAALIKMSRLETGILSLSPKEMPVMPMLEKVFAQYADAAGKKGLSFSLLPPEDNAVWAVFDEKWTLEALGNLVDNAIKYTSQGSVTLSVTCYELFCRIAVTDTGIGIPESQQAQIFSRFYRAPQVSELEGIGIGLYLAREIISAEYGYLKVSSSPGCGATFYCYLPLAEK